jgi:flavin reductase (DIM6/NTAB) family NADH-FMN oxidoreductase RutF
MRKPWNRVSLPVYSVSSMADGQQNMHICTYVSAVSMNPKRYMVALYEGTKTRELVERYGHFLLQLLHEDQYSLVRHLGQQSGHSKDKLAMLRKRGQVEVYNSFYYLREALAIIECKVLTTMEGGDHKLFLCDVLSHRNLREGSPLTTRWLQEKKIIRA